MRAVGPEPFDPLPEAGARDAGEPGGDRLIDDLYYKHPFYGSRRIAESLKRQGREVNRKRVQRLMQLMGLGAIHPKPRTTIVDPEHRTYPYLLRDVKVTRRDHVWSSDVTYVPMRGGYMYMTAVMDWGSRYVLSWRPSNAMDVEFCLEALEEALSGGSPEVFNTDQGSQFTSRAYTTAVLGSSARMSMDGRSRALDNVFVERLWRSVKYEDLYLKDYATVEALEEGLEAYFRFYNNERMHQSLSNQTPAEVYFARATGDELTRGGPGP